MNRMLKWILSLLFFALATTEVAALVISNIVDGTGIGGVTALCQLPPHFPPEDVVLVAIGSKRGSVYLMQIANDDSILSIDELDSETGRIKIPYPIHSMACDGSKTLFCGGGDRYISVWEEHNDEAAFSKGWKMIQRLGPHTGWVKAVVFDAETSNLFSIGCNCIETWKRSDGEGWKHLLKSSIASDPMLGSTLSSDLLCLCVLEGDGMIASGGVDGRIHLWDASKMGEPVFYQSAHDGRVNALAFDKLSNLLLSVGNDGYLRLWLISGGSFEECKCVDMGSKNRATSLTCWRDTSVSTNALKAAVGTSEGEVIIIRIDMEEDLSFQVLQREILEQKSVVNSILKLPDKNGVGYDTALLLAHSVGLGCVVYSKKLFEY